MPVDDRSSLALRLVLLLMVPVLLPWRVRPRLRRQQRIKIDRSHVHHLERILVFERNIRHKSCMHDGDVVERSYLADAEYYGTRLEIGYLRLSEGFREFKQFGVVVCNGIFHVAGFIDRVDIGPRDGRVMVFGSFVNGQEDFVFVVAANTRGT